MDISDVSKSIYTRTHAQTVAYQKYKAHKNFYKVSDKIRHLVFTLGTNEQLKAINTLLNEVNITRIGSIHQYTVCPACYHALYKHKPTSRFKNFTYRQCCLCKTYASSRNHLYIRNKLSLDEAKAKIQIEHPEIFL